MATIQDLGALTDPVSDWMFGHVLSLRDNSDHPQNEVWTDVGNSPNLTGVQRRWDFGELMPQKRVYTFANLQSWLDGLNANNPGKKMVVLIEDRSFTGARDITSVTTGATVTVSFSTGHKLEDNEAIVIEGSGTTPSIDGYYVPVRLNANDLQITPAQPVTNAGPGSTGIARHTCLPEFLHDEGYAIRNSSGAYTADRTKTYYQHLLFDLYRKIYESFGSHPAFGGLAIQETSTGYNVQPPGETSDATTSVTYANAILLNVQLARVAMPGFPVFWYQNFLPHPATGDPLLNEICGRVRPFAPVMCGPDILPLNTSLNDRVYPRFTTLYPGSDLKKANSIQNDSYAAPKSGGGHYTMGELVSWGIDNLHLGTIFWNSLEFPEKDGNGNPVTGYTWYSAGAPVVATAGTYPTGYQPPFV